MADEKRVRFVREEKVTLEVIDELGFPKLAYHFRSVAEALIVRDALNAEFPPKEGDRD